MTNNVRIELPHSPLIIMALLTKAIKALEELPKSDPVLALVDLAAIKEVLQFAKDQNTLANNLRSDSRVAVQNRNNALGTTKGQNLETEGTARNLMSDLRGALKAKHSKNLRVLEQYGFTVIYNGNSGNADISDNKVDPNTKPISEPDHEDGEPDENYTPS
jgi:hypothetical protein